MSATQAIILITFTTAVGFGLSGSRQAPLAVMVVGIGLLVLTAHGIRKAAAGLYRYRRR